jgi:6,7-dimethyl-8-ribityllumazine synthase
MAMDIIEKDLDGTSMRIGIVQARFNEWAGDALRQACLAELLALGVHEDDITLVSVPGALEVPLALSALARSGDFDGLVALGCVIRGETYHFEVVSEQSAAGVARVSLEFDLPVANAILTTDTDDQARARVAEKGAEAARVVVEMANLLSELAEDGEEDVGA